MDNRDKLMQKNAWKERQSTTAMPISKQKEYDTSAIYDDPVEWMTTRGIFNYVKIDVIT